MPKISGRTLVIGGVVIGLIMLFVVVTVALRGGFSRQPEATATPSDEQVFQLDATQQATQTLVSTPIATLTLEFITVAGASCDVDCMWSVACVVNGMTLPEQNGMTRVHPHSCVPVDSSYWNITPDNPFWGMPCSRESIGVCVWSLRCIEKGLVQPVKNGLAPVLVGSCQPAIP